VWGANGRRVSQGRFRVVGCGAFRLGFDGGLGGKAEEPAKIHDCSPKPYHDNAQVFHGRLVSYGRPKVVHSLREVNPSAFACAPEGVVEQTRTLRAVPFTRARPEGPRHLSKVPNFQPKPRGAEFVNFAHSSASKRLRKRAHAGLLFTRSRNSIIFGMRG
jgi:hypothetical protein